MFWFVYFSSVVDKLMDVRFFGSVFAEVSDMNTLRKDFQFQIDHSLHKTKLNKGTSKITGVISGEKESHSEYYVDTVVPEEVVESIHTTDAFREKMVSNFVLDDGGRKPNNYVIYYYTKNSDDDLQITSDNIYHLENNKYILYINNIIITFL